MKTPAFFHPRHVAGQQDGFTVVELMLATAVFSLVLLIVTYGVLSFTHGYYAGINSSTTQSTVRNVITTVSQSIEFSGKVVPNNTGDPLQFFCAGDSLYIYRPGVQYAGTSDINTPGLYEQTLTGDCPDSASPPTSLASGGRQLLAKGMRVVLLNVQPKTTTAYAVDLRIAFGDNDLLCAPGAVANSCTSASTLADTGLTTGDVTCKARTGYQFCSVAGLSTIAAVRIQGE